MTISDFTWYGATVEMDGATETYYTADETSMVSYVNVHVVRDARRNRSKASPSVSESSQIKTGVPCRSERLAKYNQYHDSSRFCLVNKFNRKELRGKFLVNMLLSLCSRFGSPWSDEPAKDDPEFIVPQCYYAKQPPSLYFQLDTLFYIFYSMPKEEAQLYAANELHNRGWFYHREQRQWFMRAANMELLVKTNTYERGSYISFDPNTWETIPKDNFVVHYDLVEKKPALPQH
ncbi:hypothetical protein POM88_041154 [Heracleum sosnowskyi]|uniref:NOT2/NOT3/NOT5 C-terminal domain-containing protein n=1 Tax=Heracleum sosnowskyi TaxID=360622 RepID=A0AAD8HG34_9APIA|nr:hypothetical protein POM88_041154 [Heracleum sosnowskyi]